MNDEYKNGVPVESVFIRVGGGVTKNYCGVVAPKQGGYVHLEQDTS